MKYRTDVKMMQAYERYCNSVDEQLYLVYEDYSLKKERAYKRCEQIMQDMAGYDMRIVSYNSYYFSVGFCYDDILGNDCFCWITHKNEYYAPINEISVASVI